MDYGLAGLSMLDTKTIRKPVAYVLLGLGEARSGGLPTSPARPPIAPLTD